ncbi:MAG: hypothetical protein GX335_07365 [Firmicutes bacterium]|mgnify:CR=1 FL=1|nr:hypothetical protein [Bacillota bacterium]
MDRTRAMVQDIKKQVLAELEGQNYPGGTPATSFQAYCQLVDAIRQEVLLDLKGKNTSYLPEQELVDAVKADVLRQLTQTQNQEIPERSGSFRYQLSPAEIEAIKKEVLFELQKEQEGGS